MTKSQLKTSAFFLPEGENKFQSGGEKKRREGRKEKEKERNEIKGHVIRKRKNNCGRNNKKSKNVLHNQYDVRVRNAGAS